MQRLYIILAIILLALLGIFLFALYLSFSLSLGVVDALVAIFSGEAFFENTQTLRLLI